MKWFTNLKVRTKLIASFVIIAIFTVVVGLIGINSMGQINDLGNEIYEVNFISAEALANLNKDLETLRGNHNLMLFERDETQLQSRLDILDDISAKANEEIQVYETKIQTEEERAIYNDLISSLEKYREIRAEHVNMIVAGNYEDAIAGRDQLRELRTAAQKDLDRLIDYNLNEAERKAEEGMTTYKNQSIIMIAVAVIGAVLAVGLGLIISGTIARPLAKLVDAANEIADGNLDIRIDIDSKDEIGNLVDVFRIMVNNTNDVMTNIRSASEQVAAGARQISDSSMDLSQGAAEQASSVEELTASLEEISSQTELNAQNANEANELAEEAEKNALQGNERMQNMLVAMNEINDSSGNISKIIKVIDEIAFQTNILALNAAVEAARAGQHGRGFAVVAEEVRNLAARSADAAKETTEMIENSIQKTEDGMKIADETAKALNEIIEEIEEVANLIDGIAAASNEQAAGIEQVNQGIVQVSDVVQTVSATSEEGAAASEELASQAQLLQEQVRRFKLRTNGHSKTYNETEEVSPEVLKMLDSINNNKKSDQIKEYNVNNGETIGTNSKEIVLSDEEFGKY